MIQHYKHEIVRAWKQHRKYWRFYWEVNNTSGRSAEQISADIAEELGGVLGWWQYFRFFWPQGSECHGFRFQRLTPDRSDWCDLFWTYRNDGNSLPIAHAANQVKVNVNWVCQNGHRERCRTEIDSLVTAMLKGDEVVDDFTQPLQDWVDLTLGSHVTSSGDEFRFAHLDINGQFLPIVAGWIDWRMRSRQPDWRKV